MNTLQTFANTQSSRGAFYRAVWRWHFYAGLFCIPFVIALALTGSIYLFKPQVEAWLDRGYDDLAVSAPFASPDDQVRAALAAHPGGRFKAIEVRRSPTDAARVLLDEGSRTVRVYVHPKTGAVLASIAEDDRPMPIVRRIHGELMVGEIGSILVELAASWAIVMILTGLYLWWPRQARGLGGLVYPRWRLKGRLWWRDLHAVTGVWISLLALFLLLSALPWTSVWGEGFKTLRQVTGTAAQQDWSTGRFAGHADHDHEAPEHAAGRPTSIGRMVATARMLDLPGPVVLSPPAGGDGAWTLRSDTQNRPLRSTLKLDPVTGRVVARQDFGERHPIDRIVGYAIAAHEGQLFGAINQALGVLTAAGLVALSVSGAVMWWRRRPQGELGAPRRLASHASAGLAVLIGALALLLPLFGASLVLVALIERLVLKQVPEVSRWLGLGVAPAPTGRR